MMKATPPVLPLVHPQAVHHCLVSKHQNKRIYPTHIQPVVATNWTQTYLSGLTGSQSLSVTMLDLAGKPLVGTLLTTWLACPSAQSHMCWTPVARMLMNGASDNCADT
eukprot:5701452-Amphidinium_carterae.1